MNNFESEYFHGVLFRTAAIRNNFDRKIEEQFLEGTFNKNNLNDVASKIYSFIDTNEIGAPWDFVTYDRSNLMESILDELHAIA